jgi:phospholipid/cholesterol/gamma-HCH transport system substrate-binding protein
MRRVIATAALLATIALAFFAQASGGSGGTYEVRAIFDNGGFVVPAEDVRIAGANVGTVESVGVTMPGDWVNRDDSPDPGKAVVVMSINDTSFQNWSSDASCLIRPGSLLGEKYVDCKPTQPRAPGTPPPAPLKVVPDGQPGAGQHFLPLQNNGKEVDIDLVNNIMREPFADRFRLILNDLGAGLGARGQDLAAIVRRADPALRETDKLLGQLARQNHMLSSLAKNSDKVLAPLARERQHIAGFIRNANTAGEATAERASDLEAGLQKFPAALRALRGQMAELQHFSNQARPTFADFAAAAPNITRSTKALGPFARAATPSLVSLGNAAQQSAQPLVKADPILVALRKLAEKSAPGAKSLNALLSTFRATNGNQHLLHTLYETVGATNGLDKFGHFLRASVAFNSNCITILSTPNLSCTAQWNSQTAGKLAAQRAVMEGPAKLANAGAPSSSGGTPLDATGDLAGSSTKSQKQSPGLGKVPMGATRDLLNTIIGQPGPIKPSDAPPQHYTPPGGGDSNDSGGSTGGSSGGNTQYRGANP